MVNKRFMLCILLFVLCGLALAACRAPEITPTLEPTAVSTEIATEPLPTETAVVTHTPAATATTPSLTPQPTDTPAAQLPIADIVDDACAELVLNTLAVAQTVCGSGTIGTACVAGGPVSFQPAVLDAPIAGYRGDIVPLESLLGLHTGQVHVEQNEWGVAVLQMQPAGQASSTKLMMTGDVLLNNATDSATLAISTNLTVRTSSNVPQCPGAANNLIIQSPLGETVTLIVDGVTLEMTGATLAIQAVPHDKMTITVLAGSVVVTALGESQTLIAGQMTTILLGGENGLTPIAPPTIPAPFDPILIQYLPFHIIVDFVKFHRKTVDKY